MTMAMTELARQHRLVCPTLALRPVEELVLWYSDIDLSLSGRNITYRCPECGIVMTIPQEEFMERDSSLELRCNNCRGEPDERSGGMK
jgi:predicted RNA-binding Zn-ribbon protein involved in translation (DUF1610 family)